jgi:hypothetical protein
MTHLKIELVSLVEFLKSCVVCHKELEWLRNGCHSSGRGTDDVVEFVEAFFDVILDVFDPVVNVVLESLVFFTLELIL